MTIFKENVFKIKALDTPFSLKAKVETLVPGMKRNGFTLIEILIVMALIAVLAVAGVGSFTASQKRGRDSRRRTDMKSIQNAWEQYYGDNKSNYPYVAGDPTGCVFSGSTAGAMTATYMPNGLPLEPKTGLSYTATTGWASCTTTSYCFCSGLEGETNSTKDCGGTNGAPEGYTGLYCVKNLQ